MIMIIIILIIITIIIMVWEVILENCLLRSYSVDLSVLRVTSEELESVTMHKSVSEVVPWAKWIQFKHEKNTCIGYIKY